MADKDIYKDTARLLIDQYGLSSRFVNMLAEERNIDNLLNVVQRRLSVYDKLELMLRIEGSDFFAGSKKSTKELRKRIIDCWTEDVRDDEFRRRCNSEPKSNSQKSGRLAEMNWHRGASWPRAFMEISGIDLLFCGKKNNAVSYEDFEDVEPYKRLPQLKEYQLHLKDELKAALAERGDEAKCLISLPTGAGKTRIAVEAYTEYLRPRFFEGKYLIWIAQSEELGEQAVATFQQIWQHKEFTESLRIYRLYSNHQLHEQDMCGGVVVCSINKLYNAIKGGNYEVRLLIENCGACIIDEAHRAVTMMYNTFYAYSQRIRGEKMFPVCGLTATPGRTDDITQLTRFFVYRLVTPLLPAKYQAKPVNYFRDKRYLARPIHEIISTGTTYTIEFPSGKPDPSLEELEFEVGRGCKELAQNIERNQKILQRLLAIKDGQVIVYACNVEHAELLAAALTVHGRKAVAITAATSRMKRLLYIERFRNGEIEFLVNHSVLTTGFDAPKTNYIVICRPIFSDILYEQIVGRGLRGPEFGGTESCLIIDFTDNLVRFGDQQSYHRFEDFWETE
ncbi:MAG: DEAD/DEAH box helicase family protein [Prevotella sp.]|nr:DEAD/DEAH box helicase family protein [Prevotella sp.]